MIHNQLHRRTLTQEELVRCRREIDKRKPKGATTGARRDQSRQMNGGIETHSPSAAETPEMLGTSARMVERLRTIDDHGASDVIADVEAGEKSVMALRSTGRRVVAEVLGRGYAPLTAGVGERGSQPVRPPLDIPRTQEASAVHHVTSSRRIRCGPDLEVLDPLYGRLP